MKMGIRKIVGYLGRNSQMIPHFHEDRLGVILKELEPFKKEIQGIVVESTYNWYWLVDGLQEAKYKVHLANPAEMQRYSGMKYTDDKWDSYWLAHMLRLGILPEGYIYPKEIRPIRDLLRKRTIPRFHEDKVGAAQTCPRGNGERRMY